MRYLSKCKLQPESHAHTVHRDMGAIAIAPHIYHQYPCFSSIQSLFIYLHLYHDFKPHLFFYPIYICILIPFVTFRFELGIALMRKPGIVMSGDYLDGIDKDAPAGKKDIDISPLSLSLLK